MRSLPDPLLPHPTVTLLSSSSHLCCLGQHTGNDPLPRRFPVVSVTLQSLDFLLAPLAAAPGFPRRAVHLPSSQGSALPAPLLTPRSHFSSPPFTCNALRPLGPFLKAPLSPRPECPSWGFYRTHPALDPGSLPSVVIHGDSIGQQLKMESTEPPRHLPSRQLTQPHSLPSPAVQTWGRLNTGPKGFLSYSWNLQMLHL